MLANSLFHDGSPSGEPGEGGGVWPSSWQARDAIEQLNSLVLSLHGEFSQRTCTVVDFVVTQRIAERRARWMGEAWSSSGRIRDPMASCYRVATDLRPAEGICVSTRPLNDRIKA